MDELADVELDIELRLRGSIRTISTRLQTMACWAEPQMGVDEFIGETSAIPQIVFVERTVDLTREQIEDPRIAAVWNGTSMT